MANVRVLGRYEPSEYDIDVIEREVRALECLPACCRRERIGVRVPRTDPPEVPENNMHWHQDGGGREGCCRHIVVWASETPTEIRDADGTEFTAQPFELAWVDNDVAHHRQPRGTNETTRWFFAIRCSGAVS